jgi:methyl-accepting chemotaxis protein
MRPLDGAQLVEAMMGETAGRLAQASDSVDGVLLEVDGELFRIGQTEPGGIAYERSIRVGGRQLREASLTLYLPPIHDQLGSERKELLLTMGGVFLLFGFILQQILDQVLSKPFRQMVSAAQAFSAGDEKVRFDEQRSDEFGYLGRFINRRWTIRFSRIMPCTARWRESVVRNASYRRRRKRPWLRCTPSATR